MKEIFKSENIIASVALAVIHWPLVDQLVKAWHLGFQNFPAEPYWLPPVALGTAIGDGMLLLGYLWMEAININKEEK